MIFLFKNLFFLVWWSEVLVNELSGTGQLDISKLCLKFNLAYHIRSSEV